MAFMLRVSLTVLGLIALKGSLQDLKIYDDPAAAPHYCEAFKFEVSVRPQWRRSAGDWPRRAAPRRTARPARHQPVRLTSRVCFIRYRLRPVPRGGNDPCARYCMPITIVAARIMKGKRETCHS